MEPNTTRKTVGLALGSGGVRGLAHIGVIKTLLKHNIPIDFIAGSSIGAWVGAHYALYQDIQKLEEVTVQRKDEVMDTLFEPSLRGGFVGGEKAKKLLSKWLNSASFKDTKIPLAVVATDLNKREACVFTSGSLVPAVQASMAVPGMFKPILHEGRMLVDGGISYPVPSDVVKKMGADIVIAVNLYHIPEDPTKNKTGFGFLSVASRTMEIMRYYLAKNSMNAADIVIEPSLEKYAGWTHYFMNKDIGKEIVEVGAVEIEKIIPELKKIMM